MRDELKKMDLRNYGKKEGSGSSYTLVLVSWMGWQMNVGMKEKRRKGGEI